MKQKRIKPKNGKVMSFYANERVIKLLANEPSKSATINLLIETGHYAQKEFLKAGK